jgi:eukaryotic-like serine/threonine-protein kinase
MPLAAGTKLGSYQVTAQIGAGGMGEVYQAHDTKLGRDVAIKVLPEAFARDPERLSRFQREAKLLASLNHSNIATIHGLEESNGTHYLVMELVSGENLAERVKRDGAVPIEESLTIAKQIAEALEAAHEKGVIHRDLKPANVKVTPEGKVKVLDFGLAKAFAGDGANEDPSNSPTLSMAATMQGVILGTAAYMSPEQAKGKAVDKRTDIFAFGAVLYELLTGKQAFHGEDVGDILAAVVMKEPAFDSLPRNTPTSIRVLLQRCLRKDKRQRLSDATDVRIEIEDAIATPKDSGGTQAAPAKRSWRDRLAWPALAGVLLLALAAVSFLYFREAPAVAPEMRTEIVTPSTTEPVSFALSPDGRQIVFVASGDGASRLWLRRLDATSAQPLAGTEGASYPFWSPDSRSVGFFADDKLKRIGIGGGLPQTLTDAVSRGGTWGLDGTILFTRTGTGPLFRIPTSGGGPVAVTKLDKQSSHRFPQFLPGGRQFLFYAQGPAETAGIYLGSLDSPETKRLTAADTAGVYFSEQYASTARTRSPDGWLLFIRAGTLLAQRLNLERGELKGDPATVADPVTSDTSFDVGAFSVSAAGLVAYRTGGAGQHQLVWFDSSGKTLGTMGAPDANSLNAPSLSPDGRRAAVSRTVQGNSDIWLLDATRATRFTFDPSRDQYPIWSPDGSRIVFDSNRKGHRDLYVKSSNGAGGEELLLESAQDKNATDWSRDGRFLLYTSTDPQTGYDLWVLPMEGERKPFVFLKTSFDERRGKFSPDGRWVAYMSNESGRYEVYVRPFFQGGLSAKTEGGPAPVSGTAPGASSGAGVGGQWQVSASGGINPRWRADGKELYYIAPDGKLMAAPIAANSATIAPGTPVALFQPRIFGGGTDPSVGTEYDVSGDGRFLIDTVLEDAASPITLLQNWTAGLKK